MCVLLTHPPSCPLCSPQTLMLAAKLQAKLAQHMAPLPPADPEVQQLRLLLHMHGLETAARQEDGAALLQCLSSLRPHAASLEAAQRTALLGMVSGQHSRVVQEAACGLLLASVAADGSLAAVALVPALLSQLALSEEQQLRALAGCQRLLAALPASERSPAWAQCSQARGWAGCCTAWL